jgi:hypothetical protein
MRSSLRALGRFELLLWELAGDGGCTAHEGFLLTLALLDVEVIHVFEHGGEYKRRENGDSSGTPLLGDRMLACLL